MARTPYKLFNINRIGPGKRVNGKSGKAETTIFWPHYSGKCRTVGTYSPRRNHGMVTASSRPRRQWIHDIEEWTGCEYIQLKEMSQDRAQWRRKISEWSSAVANPHRGRSTSEWVSVSGFRDGTPKYVSWPNMVKIGHCEVAEKSSGSLALCGTRFSPHFAPKITWTLSPLAMSMYTNCVLPDLSRKDWFFGPKSHYNIGFQPTIIYAMPFQLQQLVCGILCTYTLKLSLPSKVN